MPNVDRTNPLLKPFNLGFDRDGHMPSDAFPPLPQRKASGPVEIKPPPIGLQPKAPPGPGFKPGLKISTSRFVRDGELVDETPRRQPVTTRHFRADQVLTGAAQFGALSSFESAGDPAPTCSFCHRPYAIVAGDVFVKLEASRPPERVACAGCCSQWPSPRE